ncbi:MULTISPECIES: 2-amino-4-hydroxy-6-hydroxymethyldihydropteridine diphosphokinase [Nitrincola]|uniref:2-amino-4-hydroxy-6-hydroxymethyldihydropteridine diphosphokinase n=1 Tax=Nitrincola nitratireducens TaxID=1229521 RepID=W9UXF4_9GAMM|nr:MULTISPECIES: 2-amino-4-hydroxy-6-hydroxymethyldihydropteridine diphosphokinase [Nitrincola]EXJ11759.1 2-amino-4-hydroxy-6-hydroxymethyldihydropteridine pyrophosphokinase [Nitrincola nitratireducens]
MALVYLSLGSNVDRERYILAALDALADQFGELGISSVYESESVGFKGSPFFNLVVKIETSMSVGDLSRWLKMIEDQNGRKRGGPRFCSRTLDIDILTYDDCVGEVDGIQLPRDEVDKNAFVLWPLAELAPDEQHPVRQLPYAFLWQNYTANQPLWRVDFSWRGRQISSSSIAGDTAVDAKATVS